MVIVGLHNFLMNMATRSSSSSSSSSSLSTHSSASSTLLERNPDDELLAKINDARFRKKMRLANYPMEDLYWEDLFDPVRFAIPSVNFALECSMEKLPEDAEIISTGRMGKAYRKTLQGFDCVVKVLFFLNRRDELDGERWVRPTKLRKEMAKEVSIYKHLRRHQGSLIPRLLWYGEIIEAQADAVVTEYCGRALDSDIKDITLTEAKMAQKALFKLHECGVLHGDIREQNYVVSEDGSCVRIIDFGWSKTRMDFDSDESWNENVKMERRRIQEVFFIPHDLPLSET